MKRPAYAAVGCRRFSEFPGRWFPFRAKSIKLRVQLVAVIPNTPMSDIHDQKYPNLRSAAIPVAAFLLVMIFAGWAYSFAFSGTWYYDDAPNLAGLEQVDDWLTGLNFATSGIAGPTGRPVSLATFAFQANAWPDDSERISGGQHRNPSFQRRPGFRHRLADCLRCWRTGRQGAMGRVCNRRTVDDQPVPGERLVHGDSTHDPTGGDFRVRRPGVVLDRAAYGSRTATTGPCRYGAWRRRCECCRHLGQGKRCPVAGAGAGHRAGADPPGTRAAGARAPKLAAIAADRPDRVNRRLSGLEGNQRRLQCTEVSIWANG